MYLNLLRAGGSQSAIELMAPFGLDPRDPNFWRRGIEASVTNVAGRSRGDLEADGRDRLSDHATRPSVSVAMPGRLEFRHL